MPKLGFSRLPPQEEAICLRVRSIREDNRLSQAVFASRLGISRDRLASYEYARAPIRWDIGMKICLIFKRSQRWLAEGKIPKRGPWLVLAPCEEPYSETLFSAGYAMIAPGVLRAMEALVRELHVTIEFIDFLPDDLQTAPGTVEEIAASYRSLLPELIAHDLRSIPDSLVPICSEMIIAKMRGLRMRALDPKLAEEWVAHLAKIKLQYEASSKALAEVSQSSLPEQQTKAEKKRKTRSKRKDA